MEPLRQMLRSSLLLPLGADQLRAIQDAYSCSTCARAVVVAVHPAEHCFQVVVSSPDVWVLEMFVGDLARAECICCSDTLQSSNALEPSL